jgi:hypothetical protein
LKILPPNRATPQPFPIMVDRMQKQLRTEKLMGRIEKMKVKLEKAESR